MDLFLYTILFLFIIASVQYTTKDLKNNLSNYKLELVTGQWPFILYIALGIYVVIRAIVYDTGADYLAYYNHFVTRSHHLIDVWGEGREIGYRYLIDFLSSYFSYPYVFFGVCAFVGMGSLLCISLKFGKAAPYIVLGWALYLFNLSMNLYRQYIAMSLIFYALYILLNQKVKKKKLLGASICIILAYFFHRSSLVGVLCVFSIYFLRNHIVNKWILIGALMLTTVASMTVLSHIISVIGAYSDSFMAMNDRGYMATEMLQSQYDVGKMTYVNMLCSVVLIWYGDRVLNINAILRYFYLVMAICFIITPLTNQVILMRMRLYLTNFAVIGYGLTLYFNKKLYNVSSNILLVIVVVYQIFYMFLYQNSLLLEAYPLQFKY